MLKKVFITGGTGFLGCHLARMFIKKDYKVTLYDIAPLTALDLLGKVTVVKGDVRNKQSLEKALKGQEFVIHAAAAMPIQHTKERIFSTNINGTKNVLDISLKHKVKRLIFISSTNIAVFYHFYR